MHKAWYRIEEVPYYFSRSSIKFQGHMGWKIYDLNPFWVRLLSRSQLSNPSDLPCYLCVANQCIWPFSCASVKKLCYQWFRNGPSHINQMILYFQDGSYQISFRHGVILSLYQCSNGYKMYKWGWNTYQYPHIWRQKFLPMLTFYKLFYVFPWTPFLGPRYWVCTSLHINVIDQHHLESSFVETVLMIKIIHKMYDKKLWKNIIPTAYRSTVAPYHLTCNPSQSFSLHQ